MDYQERKNANGKLHSEDDQPAIMGLVLGWSTSSRRRTSSYRDANGKKEWYIEGVNITAFRNKYLENQRLRAQKRIYFWIIQRLYRPESESASNTKTEFSGQLLRCVNNGSTMSATTESYLESVNAQALHAGLKGGLVAGSGYHYERDHCDFETDSSEDEATSSDEEFIDDEDEATSSDEDESDLSDDE